ncbi:MAG: hypothetical protein ACOYOM_05020 [Chloroflexota bacterium]
MANEDLERRQSPPTATADAIHRAIIARYPNPRYIAGFITSSLLFARKMLPDTSLDAAVTAAYATDARLHTGCQVDPERLTSATSTDARL